MTRRKAPLKRFACNGPGVCQDHGQLRARLDGGGGGGAGGGTSSRLAEAARVGSIARALETPGKPATTACHFI